jgi:hypothetical protein
MVPASQCMRSWWPLPSVATFGSPKAVNPVLLQSGALCGCAHVQSPCNWVDSLLGSTGVAWSLCGAEGLNYHVCSREPDQWRVLPRVTACLC